jgi:hypothetical protein
LLSGRAAAIVIIDVIRRFGVIHFVTFIGDTATSVIIVVEFDGGTVEQLPFAVEQLPATVEQLPATVE